MISVIIPAYNAAGTITECLEALTSQTYQDLEIVVVDDGSIDDTALVVKNFAKEWPALRLIQKENGGAPSARNRGIKETAGELVFFCDADVIVMPHALMKLKTALDDNPDAAFAYSSFKFGWKTFELFPFDAARLRKMPYIHTNTLVRRLDLPSTGWDENLKRFQDWDLFLTMAQAGKRGIWVPEVLFQISNTHGTMSSWVPAFAYKLPWHIIGWMPKTIRGYKTAMEVIRKKHNL